MSRPVGAHIEGKLRERYEAAEEEEQPQNKSDFLRSLLREGLDAREKTTYEKAGLSERLVGELEEVRAPGDREEDVLREVVEEGLEARRSDVLDAIDASDGLRERVEEVREDDEDLEAVVRRLIREGAQQSTTLARESQVASLLAETAMVSFIIFAIIQGAFGQYLQGSVPFLTLTFRGLLTGAVLVVILAYMVGRAKWVVTWVKKRKSNLRDEEAPAKANAGDSGERDGSYSDGV